MLCDKLTVVINDKQPSSVLFKCDCGCVWRVRYNEHNLVFLVPFVQALIVGYDKISTTSGVSKFKCNACHCTENWNTHKKIVIVYSTTYFQTVVLAIQIGSE